MNSIVEECCNKSIELLKENSTKYGVLASAISGRAVSRSYLSIFGRDASICAIGMAASGNKELIALAGKSLLTLAKYQAGNGQIPNYVKPEIKHSDFWYLGCIDATLWWLIAIKYYDRYADNRSGLEKGLDKRIDLAVKWLLCQEHQEMFLLQQNEASDWADIMPRSGFVMYTNALWYWVKSLYGLTNAAKTRMSFEYLLNPWQKIPAGYLEENKRAAKLIAGMKKEKRAGKYYLSYVNYLFHGTDIDVYGNILACLGGVASKAKVKEIIAGLIADKIGDLYPTKACLNPIKEDGRDWREYMKGHKQNYPEQYHNGGIWPFIGGFWVAALALNGYEELAEKTLENLARANAQRNWQFNEWFHGQAGKPMGMAKQSWNAGTFLLAYNCLHRGYKL